MNERSRIRRLPRRQMEQVQRSIDRLLARPSIQQNEAAFDARNALYDAWDLLRQLNESEVA